MNVGRADDQPPARLHVVAVAVHRLGPAHDDLVVGAAGDRAAAHDALDVVLGHEVHGPLAAGHHGLPALHGLVLGTRHQGQLLQRVAPVRHFRRNLVVLAVIGEGVLVERLHYDFDLFLEYLPVHLVVTVGAGYAEGIHLPRVVAPAHAEDDPPVGEDVGGGVVLGQPQWVPHGVDVEAAAELELLGHPGQVDEQHQQVGDDLVALVLEVVLRAPEAVIAQPVHQLGHLLAAVEDGDEVVVVEAPVVDRGGFEAQVPQVHVPRVEAAKVLDHACPR